MNRQTTRPSKTVAPPPALRIEGRAPLYRRAFAFLVDTFAPVTIGLGCSAAVLAASLPARWWAVAAILLAMTSLVLWNSIVAQGLSGSTAGMKLVGLRRVRVGGDGPIGIPRACLRFGCIVLDLVPVPIGLSRPLWNQHGQRFSDRVADAIVIADELDAKSRSRWARRAPLVIGIPMVVLLALVSVQAFVQRPADQRLDETRDTVAQVAIDGAVAILSYQPETVDQDLARARSRLTGEFLDAYASLADDVVAPTAKEKRVAMRADAVGAAVESATEDSASVIVYLNQAATLAADESPSLTQNAVRVGLVQVNGHWLIQRFDPLF